MASVRIMSVSAVPTTVPTLLILGTDAVLAAAPATPVQLAHACLAAGYHAVIPASWGDELIAARAIDRVQSADASRVMCSCPLVSRRLSLHGEWLAPVLLHFVPPPVVTALYLRSVYSPARPHITYVGGCPAASHESIDAWIAVDEFLDQLAQRGIATSAQPTEFDSVLPPDRRRHYSEPGGLPSRHAIRQIATPFEIVELRGTDLAVDLAQQLLTGSRALIDVALAVGCRCSGASAPNAAEGARARVRELEPPRAASPVVDHAVPCAIEVAAPAPPLAPQAGMAPQLDSRRTEVAPSMVAAGAVGTPVVPVAVETLRRRSPPGVSRPILGAMPVARAESGRQLPRAFVARRRSSPRGLRRSMVRGLPLSQRVRSRDLWLWVAVVAGAVGLALVVRFVF